MNLLNTSSLLLLALVLLFASCEKENFDNIVAEDPVFQPDSVQVNSLVKAGQTTSGDGLELGCITIQFPFDLLLESGQTIIINSSSDFEAAVDATSPDIPVDFVFPLTVTTADGESISVGSNEELGPLFGSCIPEEGWEDTTSSNGSFKIPAFLFADLCFDLVYPVDVQDAAENVTTVNNEAELIDLLATTPNLSFVLPITVVDEAGTETVIESVAGFYDLYYSCDGVTPPGTEGGNVIDLSFLDSTDCNFETLDVQFPYNVVTADGESITVADENQEAALILSGESYTIQYPFTMVDADGVAITLNDEAEFIALILPCLITIGEPADTCDTDAHVLLFFNAHNIFTVFPCPFDIDYPVDVTIDGTPATLNSVDDYFEQTGAPYNFGDVDLIYPITVTVAADGSTVVLNSDQDVCDLITGCE